LKEALVDDGVFSIAGEARELPDEDSVKGRVFLLGEVNDLFEGRALGVGARSGLVFEDSIELPAFLLSKGFEFADLAFDGCIEVSLHV